ncbi:MAG: amidohydrolase [Peptostreptococcales bacterium]
MIKIDDAIQALKEEVVSVRRKLHQCPEGGFKEYKTSAYIKEKLSDFGIKEIDECAGTGIVAMIRGTAGERAIGFRTDMDALPIEENTQCAYQSQHEGFMHACGHDGHMAAMLGFAKYAAANSNMLKQNIALIFQPAEEGPGGAARMIEEGIIEKYNIKRMIGMHIFPEYPENKVISKAGPMMARNGEVSIKIIGTPAHGAIPQRGKDAIMAAAYFITSVQSILSRNIDPMESAVFTIGTISGGNAANIIAEEVKLKGTIRAFTDKTYDFMTQRIAECAKGIEYMSGCKIELSFHHMYRIVDNDENLYAALKKVAGDDFIEAKPVMISEDFSFFQQKVPGLFFFIGSYNKAAGFTNSLHNSQFNFDEEILLTAIQLYWDILKEI